MQVSLTGKMLTIAWTLALAPSLFALDPQKTISKFTHILVAKDGIPGPVRAIAQTPGTCGWEQRQVCLCAPPAMAVFGSDLDLVGSASFLIAA